MGVCGPFGRRVGGLGGCMSVGVYIGIVYIMPTIGGICVSCWLSVGPWGPGWGDVAQCIYHYNNRMNETWETPLQTPLNQGLFKDYSTWWGFSSFAVFVYTLYLCICNLYLHDLQLKIWFMTYLYQGLLKNVALDGVYGHFINHCICVYTVFVYLCECVCM